MPSADVAVAGANAALLWQAGYPMLSVVLVAGPPAPNLRARSSAQTPTKLLFTTTESGPPKPLKR
eukprot:3373186-Amphidinium_carterae.1